MSVSVGASGLKIATADNNDLLQIKPRLQTDMIWFPNSTEGTSQFYIRRAQLSFRGTDGPVSYVFTPNFATSSVFLEDAWVDFKQSDELKFEAGKMIPYTGLENTQSAGKILFIERGLQNNLVGSRDIGVKTFGSAFGNVLNYGVSLTNGVLDGQSMNGDAAIDNDKLWGGYMMVNPFAAIKDNPYGTLALGVASDFGHESTSLNGNTDRTISYKTAGRSTFLSLNNVTITGDHSHLNPQAYYYYDSFGLLSEYVSSAYRMSRGGVTRDIENSGFTIQGSYVLTGEKASFTGVKPAHPFSFKDDGWGAFEVAARYNEFSGDKNLFAGKAATTEFATATSTQNADAYGIALKWYLTQNLMWAVNYEVTDFSGLGAYRRDEHVVMSRFQIDF